MKAEIREYLKNEGYILNFWHRNDIMSKAKEMEVGLTEEQINHIVEKLERVDCNFGINWDTIESYILDQVGE